MLFRILMEGVLVEVSASLVCCSESNSKNNDKSQSLTKKVLIMLKFDVAVDTMKTKKNSNFHPIGPPLLLEPPQTLFFFLQK